MNGNNDETNGSHAAAVIPLVKSSHDSEPSSSHKIPRNSNTNVATRKAPPEQACMAPASPSPSLSRSFRPISPVDTPTNRHILSTINTDYYEEGSELSMPKCQLNDLFQNDETAIHYHDPSTFTMQQFDNDFEDQQLQQHNEIKIENKQKMKESPHEHGQRSDGSDDDNLSNNQVEKTTNDIVNQDNNESSRCDSTTTSSAWEENAAIPPKRNSQNSNDNDSNQSQNNPHSRHGPYCYCICYTTFLRCIHRMCTPHTHPPCSHLRSHQSNRFSQNSISSRLSNPTLPRFAQRIPPQKRRILCRSLIIIFMIITITFTLLDLLILHRYLNVWLASTLDWLSDNPISGGLAFMGIFLLASLCFFPVALLTLGAGYVYIDLYGLGLGIIVAFCVCYFGSLLGAAVCFMRSRYLMRQLIQKFANRYPIVRAVDRAFGTMGFRLFLLLRLSPAMPFNALNYIGGITAVRFRDYWLATCVGIIPGLLWTIFVGATFGSMGKRGVDGNEEFDQDNVRKGVVLGLGIGLGVMGLIGTGIYARKELTKIVLAEQMEIMREEQAAMEQTQELVNDDNDEENLNRPSEMPAEQSILSSSLFDLENPQLGDNIDNSIDELHNSIDNEMNWDNTMPRFEEESRNHHRVLSSDNIFEVDDICSPKASRASWRLNLNFESSASSSSSPPDTDTFRHLKQRPWTPESVASELPIVPSIFRRFGAMTSLDTEIDSSHTNHTSPVRRTSSDGNPTLEAVNNMYIPKPRSRQRANTDPLGEGLAFGTSPIRASVSHSFTLAYPLTNHDEMVGLAGIDENHEAIHDSHSTHVQTNIRTTEKHRGNRRRSNTDPTPRHAENDVLSAGMSSRGKVLKSPVLTPTKTLDPIKRHSIQSFMDLKNRDKKKAPSSTLDVETSMNSEHNEAPTLGNEHHISSTSTEGDASPTHRNGHHRRHTIDHSPSDDNGRRSRRHTIHYSPSGNHLELNLTNNNGDTDNGQDREWFWIWA